MRTRDENFVSMALAVQSVLQDHRDEWKPKPRFAKGVSELDILLIALRNTKARSEIVLSGATEDKEVAFERAIALGVKLAKRASVYALDEENITLHDQLRISRSAMLHRQDALALSKLNDIIARLGPILDKLKDYEVYPEHLKELEQLVAIYEDQSPQPRKLIVDRSVENRAIPKRLTEIRKVLYKLDSLINIFDDSDFESAYLQARKVIDSGGRSDEPKGEGEGPEDK